MSTGQGQGQGQGWKSHFSLHSLLPARHPPLHTDHPPLPTRHVQTHEVHENLHIPSPIRSAYASPSVYPETPYGPMSNLPPLRHAGRQPVSPPRAHSSPSGQTSPVKSPKRRPPPIDLDKIKAAYPTERAVNDAVQPMSPLKRSRCRSQSSGSSRDREGSPPILSPLEGSAAGGMSRWKALAEARNQLEGGRNKAGAQAATEAQQDREVGRGAIKKPRKVEKVVDDPFDVAVVEPGLQYPSWHAPPPVQPYTQPDSRLKDLSNVKPGQVLPRGVLASYDSRDRDTQAGETYESVLHDVLLTPTYLRDTPSPRGSSRSNLHSHSDAERNGRYGRSRSNDASGRDTLLAKARRASRAPLAILSRRVEAAAGGADARSVSSSMRAMRAREEAEMDRFRRGGGLQLGSTASFQSISATPERSEPRAGRPSRRSPIHGRNGYDDEHDTRGRDHDRGGSPERGKRARFGDEESKVELHQHHAFYHAAPLPSKRELAEREREYAYEYGNGRDAKPRKSCWTFKIVKGMNPKKVKRQQRKRKICIVLLILLLVGAIVGICLAFLLRRPSQSPPSGTSSSSYNTSTSLSASATSGVSVTVASSPAASGTASAPTASPSASTPLQKCIDTYLSLSSDIASYPCSECVPLLQGTTNDFTQPLQDQNGGASASGTGNETSAGVGVGVGAALQFCSMRDIVNAGDAGMFTGTDNGGLGWSGRDVCTWRGITCDSRGRIEQLVLGYPAVPHRIPSSISQMPNLQRIQITGNSSIPSGPFPHELVTPALTRLQLTDTALQGPIVSAPWGDAKNLTVLYLANNPILGSGVPDLRGNDKLVTLAMTGQLIGTVDTANLPGSLTYLDLSYNSLNGQVPSFSGLANLQTLYLEHNNLNSPPASLPPRLADLRLNNNPSMAGTMPSPICGQGISNCDLRATGLGGNGTSCGSCIFGSAQ